jgi:hypothetical protein
VKVSSLNKELRALIIKATDASLKDFSGAASQPVLRNYVEMQMIESGDWAFAESMAKASITQLLRSEVAGIIKAHTKPKYDTGQLSLLDELEMWVAAGVDEQNGDQRVKMKYANLSNLQYALAQHDENLGKQQAANANLHLRVEFLMMAGLTNENTVQDVASVAVALAEARGFTI